MADSKISGLPLVAAFATTQEFAVNDSGTSRKINGTQLIAAVAQGLLLNGYAQVTTTQGPYTTEVDITGLAVTVTVGTNRRIRIMCKGAVSSTVANDIVDIRIKEGATQLGSTNLFCGSTAGGFHGETSVVIQPSAGAHTYKITSVRTIGTGNITWQAGTNFPAYISVEDIGGN